MSRQEKHFRRRPEKGFVTFSGRFVEDEKAETCHGREGALKPVKQGILKGNYIAYRSNDGLEKIKTSENHLSMN